MQTWPSWYGDSEVVGFQLHFMFDTYKLIILSKHVVHIPKFSCKNSRNFCAGENYCITVLSSSLLGFFSSATEWKETLRPFLLSLRQSYCAAALEYVDIVNQPIRLCQLGKSIRSTSSNSSRIQSIGWNFKHSSSE